MSKIYSPRIVQDGLVMCLDASQNKSYPATDLPVKNGLVMWLDAADDTTFSYSSGTVVSQWRDKSGLNNHVTQSTVASQPNRNTVKNSRKSVYFDGGDTLFNSGNVFPSNTTNYTKIAVVYQTSTATTGNVIGSRTGYDGSNYGHTIYFGGLNFRMWHDTDIVTSNISLSLNTLGIISATYVNSSGLGSVFLNGTASGTGTAANRNIVQNIEIGGLFGGNNYTGEICEALVFSRVLSVTELKQVHTYLGQKWGISNTDRSIIDLSGFNDNGLFGNGTVANMPVYDYYNKGLKFNSTNANYVKVGVNSSLQVNTVTIAAFFKTITNGQTTQFIGGYGDTGFYGYWLGMSGGPMVFSVGNSTSNLQLSSTITPNNDQIYYVVGTYDGVTQRIYVDGVLKNSATTVTGVLSYSGLTDGFLIGQVQGFSVTRYMTGSIYAMQVYSRALSAAEVAQNYETMKSKFANTIVQQGLVLNLDAGNPYSYAGAGTTWYDVSGNNLIFNSQGTTQTPFTTIGGSPCFDFNGSGYWECGTNFNLVDLGGDCTIIIWFYCETTAIRRTIFEKAGTSYQSYQQEIAVTWETANDFSYYSRFSPSYDYASTAASTVNAWNMVGIKMSTGKTTAARTGFYSKNGSAWSASYNSQSNVALVAAGAIRIGSGYAGTVTDGYIGSVLCYNRMLTDAEILQNYNATKGRFGL